MKPNLNVFNRDFPKDFFSLLNLEDILKDLFTLLGIEYETQIASIKNIPNEIEPIQIKKLSQLLKLILEETRELQSKKFFMDYMEFGEIIRTSIPILNLLIDLLGSNYSQFHRECYRLLKFFWGIRFVIARFELETIPEFCQNFIGFFNLPDGLFEFIDQLKDGSYPVEILAEMDLKLRVDKRLPLLLSRTPDQISLSLLGEKLLNAHRIANYYYYYLYDFEDEVMSSE